VHLFDTLVSADVLLTPCCEIPTKPTTGLPLELGTKAASFFDYLGIDGEVSRKHKRRLFFCVDCTELRPHLGGAVGELVLQSFIKHQWLTRQRGSRVILVTSSGEIALRRLGIALEGK
jgi:hypothetical protein